MPITQTQVIVYFKQFYETENRCPKTTDFNPKGEKPFGTATVKRLFGSWDNAIRAAEITPPREKQKPKIELICTECGVKVLRAPSQVSRYDHTFCSSRCAGKYTVAHRSSGIRRSKMEIYLVERLSKAYPEYKIDSNKKICGYEIDLYFPELSFAVEVNGITHFSPIYGEDRLSRTQSIDIEKRVMCEDNGITLFILDTSKMKDFSRKKAETFMNPIWTVLDDIIFRLRKD